jgi:hypothetical protein
VYVCEEELSIRVEEKDSVGIGVSHMHLAMLSLVRRQLAPAQIDAETAVPPLVPENTSGFDRQVSSFRDSVPNSFRLWIPDAI